MLTERKEGETVAKQDSVKMIETEDESDGERGEIGVCGGREERRR